jgi:hypothetical protein
MPPIVAALLFAPRWVYRALTAQRQTCQPSTLDQDLGGLADLAVDDVHRGLVGPDQRREQ